MTLIFEQTIKLCKDAQCDVKPGGANLGVYVHTYVVYACMCSYAKIFYEMNVYLFNRDVEYRFRDAVVKVLYLFPAHS